MREKGSVAKSRDLASIIGFLGVVFAIKTYGGTTATQLMTFMRTCLGTTHASEVTTHTLHASAAQVGQVLLVAIAPIVAVALILGVVANICQTGIFFAKKALIPDFNRVNPLQGFKRLFSIPGLVESLKSLMKLAVIGGIAYSTVANGYPEISQTIRKDLVTGIGTVGDVLYRLAMRTGLFLLVLAAGDYLFQRWSFEKSIRMTKQEVKEETRQQEASPLIRGRIRSRQRQLARRRMMADVPTADVVVTNPTHFAVALKYEVGMMGAPRVVAKGADAVAQRIKDIARENNVPIVENPPLARALFRYVEIGNEIPGDFYAAVAEVLAYVYQVDQKRRRAFSHA